MAGGSYCCAVVNQHTSLADMLSCQTKVSFTVLRSICGNAGVFATCMSGGCCQQSQVSIRATIHQMCVSPVRCAQVYYRTI